MSTEFDELLGGAGSAAEASASASEKKTTFVNGPSTVPTFYSDICMFTTGTGSSVRMQFAEFIVGAVDSDDPGTKIRYTFNLIMPQEGFTSMLGYLNKVMSSADDDGE